MIMNDSAEFVKLVRDFWLQLRAKHWWVLTVHGKLRLIFFCNHGKHRSNAAMTIFSFCLRQDEFNLLCHNDRRTGRLRPSLEFLNAHRWSPRKCGGPRSAYCPDCDLNPFDRTTSPYMHRAIDIWRQQRLQLLGF